MEERRFLSVYYTLSTLLSLITGLILVLLTPVIVEFFNNEYLKYFWFIFAVLPWNLIILSSIENVLVVYNKTKNLLVFKLFNSLFLLLSVISVKLFSLSFLQYMAIYIMGQSIFALSVYIIVKNITGEKMKFSLSRLVIKNIFTFSIPIGIASVIGTLNIELGKLYISLFYGAEQLAIYSNASKELPLVIIASAITAVLIPQLTRLLKKNENEKAVMLWNNATSISYTIICLFSISFFVFAPDIIAFLYSEKYLPGVSIFRIIQWFYCCVVLILE